MNGGGLRLLATLVAALVLAGCTSEGNLDDRDIPDVDAPVWAPGNFWTYNVTHTFNETGNMKPFNLGWTGELTLRVVNATTTFDGEPVYVARSTGSPGSFPLWPADWSVLDARTFRVVAGGPLEPARTITSVNEGASGPVTSTCQTQSGLNLVDADTAMPFLTFPARTGSQWNGSLRYPSPIAGAYNARALGFETVKSPAGTFEAFHVRTQYNVTSANMPYGSRVGIQSILVDTWYAPTAKFLLRAEIVAQSVHLGPGLNAVYKRTLDLQTYSLRAGPGGPPPHILSEGRAPPKVAAIVGDQAFPWNAVNGGRDVTFGFDFTSPKDGVVLQGLGPKLVQSGVPTPPPYEHDNFTVSWRVDSNDGVQRATGDLLRVRLDRPGMYRINVQLKSTACGGATQDFAAYASVTWARTWHVAVEQGSQPDPIDIATFDAAGATSVNVAWAYVGHAVTSAPDGGHPDLRSQVGQGQTGVAGNPTSYDGYFGGNYTVSWVPEPPEVAGQSPGVMAGDDLDVTVDLKFGYPPYYATPKH